ncbi:MAG: hypothetical protein WCG55_03120 [bacterium]
MDKRDIVLQVFAELYIENGELKYKATEAYQALLMRFEASISLSCGPLGIQTFRIKHRKGFLKNFDELV